MLLPAIEQVIRAPWGLGAICCRTSPSSPDLAGAAL